MSSTGPKDLTAVLARRPSSSMGFAMIGAWQQTYGFQFVPATYWPVVRLEVQPPGIAQSFQGNQRDFALLCASAPDTRSGGTPYAASAEAGA